MTDRHIELLPLDTVRGAERNPKLHDEPGLAASLGRWGFTEAPLLDERTGRLVVGHGRLDALRAMQAAGEDPPDGVVAEDGRWLVPVQRGWSSANDQEAFAYLVAGNQLTTAGGWAPELGPALDDLVAQGTPLDGLGFTGAQLDLLLPSRQPAPSPPPPEDPDDLEPPADPVTQPGDLWQIGPHLLLCGDSRNPDHVARLLGTTRIGLAITSPPYADRRKYDETTTFRPIHPDAYVDWFTAVAANVAAHLEASGSWVVNIKAGAEGLDRDLYVHDLVLAHVRAWGWHLADEFVWERNGIPGYPARRLKSQHEPVFHFARGEWVWHPEAVTVPSNNVPVYDPTANLVMERLQGQPGMTSFTEPRARRDNHSTKSMAGGAQGTGADVGAAVKTGQAYPGNRLPTFAGSHEALGHDAAFPVDLPGFFTQLLTEPGATVYDPFTGSGSTLLAAHRYGRLGAGIELSPAYCDLTLTRLQRHLGLLPHRAGIVHDFHPTGQ